LEAGLSLSTNSRLLAGFAACLVLKKKPK